VFSGFVIALAVELLRFRVISDPVRRYSYSGAPQVAERSTRLRCPSCSLISSELFPLVCVGNFALVSMAVSLAVIRRCLTVPQQQNQIVELQVGPAVLFFAMHVPSI